MFKFSKEINENYNWYNQKYLSLNKASEVNKEEILNNLGIKKIIL